MKEQNTVKRLLFIDDDPEDLETFNEALLATNSSATLKLLSNGFAALEELDKPMALLPDIIFVDWNMPNINGIEFLREVKDRPECILIKLIMISTSATEEGMNQAFDAGAHLYIQKPDSFNEWVNFISRVLRLDWELYYPVPNRAHSKWKKNLTA